VSMHLAALLSVAVVLGGCGSQPSHAPSTSNRVEAGTNNKFFTAVSSQEIRAAEGAKIAPIANGDSHELTIISRDDDVQPIKCECPPGCGGSCKMDVDHDGIVSRATCSGTCFTSEQTACGSCSFSVPPEGGSGANTGPAGDRPDIKPEP